MCFNLLGLLAVMATGALTPATAFTGFRAITIVLVVNNALQGILSSFFFKCVPATVPHFSPCAGCGSLWVQPRSAPACLAPHPASTPTPTLPEPPLFQCRYADTILKKYSSTIATIFTGIMSAALFGHTLTLNFMLGVSVVFISMHLFFTMGERRGGGARRSAGSRSGIAATGRCCN